MTDDLSRFHGLTRSQLMARIRSKGNKKTELKLVQIFRTAKISGWRRHLPLAGRPDFVFRQARVAIFVDGCYWHGCRRHFKMPSQNIEFWSAKINANRRRDRKVSGTLRKAGWRVLRIWEHDLSNTAKVAKQVQRLLKVGL